MTQASQHEDLPMATTAETVDEFVQRSARTARGVPLRLSFLQTMSRDRIAAPGPLSEFVSTGDQRALVLYLLVLTKASSTPWNVHLPSPVWARLLGLDLPLSKSAMSTVSKTWLRLERRHLIQRNRFGRMADITVLREDGSGAAYETPGNVRERYLRVPLSLWTSGPTDDRRWYLELTLPELAVLLIALSLGDEFRLPAEEAFSWYGISADTASRGTQGLRERGLLDVKKIYKTAPLSAVGYTAEHRYTLQIPFGPIGKKSASAPSRRGAVTLEGLS
jgi:hypothetical protein